MPDRTFLSWPFFDDTHRRLADDVEAWAGHELAGSPDGDLDARTRALVRALGAAGWIRWCVPSAHGGERERVDVRSICLLREALARRDGLADAAFAMQGLGSLPISLFGSAALRERYLPDIAAGRRIAAFALSEPDAGSDVAAIGTTACRDGDAYVLDGTKTWISNAGIADQYVVFARTGEAGAKGLSALVGRRRIRPRRDRADQRHRAAPARDAALRALPGAGGPAPRRRGRRLQDRDGHARPVPSDGRRGRAGLRAARAR